MVPPHKGGSLSAEGIFEKKFSGAGEDSAVGLSRGSYATVHTRLLQWCGANAVVTRDPVGGRKFDKAKSTGRIDALVALAMALSLALLRGREAD
jgi:phage terminase large subunit-like protein